MIPTLDFQLDHLCALRDGIVPILGVTLGLGGGTSLFLPIASSCCQLLGPLAIDYCGYSTLLLVSGLMVDWLLLVGYVRSDTIEN